MESVMRWSRALLATACCCLVLALTACDSGSPVSNDDPAPQLGICEQPQSLPEAEITEDTPFFAPRFRAPLKPLDAQLGNVFARRYTPLHGDWNYLVDQLSIGDSSPLLYGGVGRNQTAGPGELLEYSFAGGDTLSVPGDWNSQYPELFWYRGVIWYQKEFTYQPLPGRRSFLYFGGGNYSKDVYVNGQLLARHRGGFTPFNTEVTDYLVPGDNAVVVRVDSMSGPDEVPTEYNDWMNYGGLTREVLLVDLPATFIRNYKIQLQKGSLDTVSGWVQLDGDSADKTVRLAIPGAGVEHSMKTDATGRAEFTFKHNLELWSPGQPRLYRVEISAGEDVVAEDIGFRSIATRGEDILLNGKPVFLRGVSLHEESLLRPGRAYGEEDAAAVIAQLQDLNANYVRLAHYPHNEHMVRAADRAGIMVWAEMPIYHNINFANPCTLQTAQRQYREFIDRDQNRAAVIMWSLANETPNTEARNQFLRQMADFVRAQDDTRLLTAALLGFGGMEDIGKYIAMKMLGKDSSVVSMLTDPDPVTMMIDDPLGEVVDVLGYNEYLGWYLSGPMAAGMRENGMDVEELEVRQMMLAEMGKFSINTQFNKPLVISEFGAGARQGMRGGDLDVWTEDYQARVYRQQLKMLANSKPLRGLSPWILKDFRAPYRLNTEIQDYWNRKGLLSETGEKKLAFDVMRDHYLERAAAQ
jgi:beta-glucuronidase